ncbi:hypothetical protein LguiA_009758 [Lonicera macranthoides]
MAPEPNDKYENPNSLAKVAGDGQQAPVDGTVDKNKTSRHSRWTRHETLVLIEGKKVAEERGRKGRRSSSGFGLDQLEPKWDSVSSYCKQRGVYRGPVQCRKRWSNLVSDFRKIKTWESSLKQEGESFWMLRNDLRRERKLPGFFDKEVFDVLDGRAFTTAAYQLALVTVSTRAKDEGEEVLVTEEDEGEEEEEEAEGEAIFDSGRHDDALFVESEKLVQEERERSPVLDRDNKCFNVLCCEACFASLPASYQFFMLISGIYEQRSIINHSTRRTLIKLRVNFTSSTAKEKQPGLHFWQGSVSREGCKRRRLSTDASEDANLEDRLINVLEKNANMLNSQLEAHNINLQLDRDQRKDHNDSLVDALKKVTDALIKVADKLTRDN